MSNWINCLFLLLPGIVPSIATQPQANEIKHVVIQKSDIDVLDGWPLDRKWYAAAIENMVSAGANRIFIDIAFPKAYLLHPESDEYFYQVLRRTPNAFLLASEVSRDSVKILGAHSLPASRFFTPFSTNLNVWNGLIRYDPDSRHSLSSFFLKREQIAEAVCTEFPRTSLNDNFNLAQVLHKKAEVMNCDVLVSLDYPGVTSYIVNSNTESLISTSSLQLYSIRKLTGGDYIKIWPRWLLAVLYAFTILPFVFWRQTTYKPIVPAISFCLALVNFVALWLGSVFVPPVMYFLPLLQISCLFYAVFLHKKREKISPQTAGPVMRQAESADLSGELKELRFKLNLYEQLSPQSEPDSSAALRNESGILCHDKSPIVSILKKTRKVAQTDVPVMLLGESGTGKEKLAQFIHESSRRSQKSFVAVNCAALNDNLVESELFGHESGAFTGANKEKMGRFELADGGTLFLDEISETSLSTQVKLLRVLQDGVFERVGGTRQFRTSARIITATHKHIETALSEGHFRKDLYYRLNGFSITLPPLRERVMDIEYLFRAFLFEKNPQLKISDAIVAWLKIQEWPGNIRELKAATERAAINSQMKNRNFFLPEDFELQHPIFDTGNNGELLSDTVLETLRKHHFKHRCISAAAAELNIHRVTVTEYLRGWIIRFMVESEMNFDVVFQLLRGNSTIENEALFKDRIRQYMAGIKKKILEGIQLGETDREIKLGRFKNIPGEFDDDLLQLIKRLKSRAYAS